MALPPNVRADITRWSHQIDRLSLEADYGRLLLRSTHPLALTAVYWVTVLMGIGLLTWLLSLLLRRLGGGALSLSFPPWVVAGLALVGTCGLVGRVGARLGLVASVHMVLLLVISVVLDCLHKEGLILHLCFVVTPVVLPAVDLSHLALSLGWVFVCFPVGIVLGLLFYTFLDAMSV